MLVARNGENYLDASLATHLAVSIRVKLVLGDATMDRVCAAKLAKSHCPFSSCCSRFQRFPPLVSFFYALHRRGSGTTDPSRVFTHRPSPAAGRLEYVARKTTTVVVALRLLTT